MYVSNESTQEENPETETPPSLRVKVIKVFSIDHHYDVIMSHKTFHRIRRTNHDQV